METGYYVLLSGVPRAENSSSPELCGWPQLDVWVPGRHKVHWDDHRLERRKDWNSSPEPICQPGGPEQVCEHG